MYQNTQKILITSILSFLFNFNFFAQMATVKGVIMDKELNEPLISATISDQNLNGVTSDLKGNYEFNISSGINIISFSYVGYKTIIKEINISIGDTLVINIDL